MGGKHHQRREPFFQGFDGIFTMYSIPVVKQSDFFFFLPQPFFLLVSSLAPRGTANEDYIQTASKYLNRPAVQAITHPDRQKYAGERFKKPWFDCRFLFKISLEFHLNCN
jgi:hypothetical protein